MSSSIKVLVVEDDKFLVGAYSLKLKSAGFDVSVARDGVEALSILKKEIPDVMILDLIMPRVDGFTVLGKMRSTPEWKDIPVIVVTNLGQEDDYERVKKIGAQDYVVKTDIALDDLVTKIKKLVGK